MKNHVIDRTFIENTANGNKVRWVVDYKMTTFDETIEITVSAEQHRPQLERYASLFVSESLPIRKAVLFLTLGELVELY